MAKIALIPGSFDPVTLGHLSLVRRAVPLFDKVVVCLLINPDKTSLFSEEERAAMLRAAARAYPNVTVDIDHGMTADYAVKIGASHLIRGIRNAADADYELEMAAFNRARAGVETILFPAPPDIADVSSTLVRERLRDGKPLDGLLPDEVIAWLREHGKI